MHDEPHAPSTSPTPFLLGAPQMVINVCRRQKTAGTPGRTSPGRRAEGGSPSGQLSGQVSGVPERAGTRSPTVSLFYTYVDQPHAQQNEDGAGGWAGSGGRFAHDHRLCQHGRSSMEIARWRSRRQGGRTEKSKASAPSWAKALACDEHTADAALPRATQSAPERLARPRLENAPPARTAGRRRGQQWAPCASLPPCLPSSCRCLPCFIRSLSLRHQENNEIEELKTQSSH